MIAVARVSERTKNLRPLLLSPSELSLSLDNFGITNEFQRERLALLDHLMWLISKIPINLCRDKMHKMVLATDRYERTNCSPILMPFNVP